MFGEFVASAQETFGSRAEAVALQQIALSMQAWFMNRTGEDGDAWMRDQLRLQDEAIAAQERRRKKS